MSLRHVPPIVLAARAHRPVRLRRRRPCEHDDPPTYRAGAARVGLHAQRRARAAVCRDPRPTTDTAAGVRLCHRQPGSGPDALKQVAAGHLDLGVLDIHDLAIAREHGIDVVGIAALVRKPLAALVTKASIKRPRDLEGHDVGVSGLPSDPAFLDAIIAHDGGKLSRVHQITIGFNAVSGILAGKVDGARSSGTPRAWRCKQRGVKVNEFRVEDYGAPRLPRGRADHRAPHAGARARPDPPRAAGDPRGCGGRRAGSPDAAVRQIAHEAQTDDTKLIGAQLAAVAPIFATDLQPRPACAGASGRTSTPAWGSSRSARMWVEAFDFSLLGG